MQSPDSLIRTKLRLPFTRAGLVARPRLQARIAQGLRGPLTLVTAPAGFGKTTLVASAVAGCGLPVAWLSLDKNDNQVGRFLRYLVAAAQAADPRVGAEAAQLLAGDQPAPAEAALTSLVNDLDGAGREMALVLDDYQLITSPAVHEAAAFLLDHCPGCLHLVVAARSDPPLPLARLRARGQVAELRAADLRFTTDEAVQFLNEMMGLRLDPGAVALLEERTEGWAAGLQLAALAMQSLVKQERADVDGFIREFAGTNRFIMDFMLEEVLAREPAEVQAFLLRTSVLNRLSGPLCDAVALPAGAVPAVAGPAVAGSTVNGASSGQAMLEALEKRNLFLVPLDDERRWYRYHHLFSDLLQARLHAVEPDLVPRLLARAADWCEQDGQIAEAIGYAFAAQDYQRAAQMIDRHAWQFANAGEIETVWNWLNALPEAMVRESAGLGTSLCMILWLTGQVGAIEGHLIDAERALKAQVESGGLEPADAALPVMQSALRAFVARYHHDYDTAIAQAEQALRLIPADLSAPKRAMFSGLGYLALGSAYDGAGDLEKAAAAYAETVRASKISGNATGVTGITYRMVGALRLLGRLRAADAACRDALEYIQAQGMARLPAAGLLHVTMSEVLVEQNSLEAAEAHLAQGIALGKWSGRLDAVKNAGYALSRLRLARGDLDGALAAVEEAEAAHVEPVSPLARAELLALKAGVLLRRGDLEEAGRCAEAAVELAGRDQGQTRGNVALASAQVAARVAAFAGDQTPRLASPPVTPSRSGAEQPGGKGEEALGVRTLTQALAEAEGRGWLGLALALRILRCLASAPEELAAAPERLHSQPAAPEELAAEPESLRPQPAAPEELAAEPESLRPQAAAPSQAKAGARTAADLEWALAMGEREGYARIFLEEGQPMQELLARWVENAGAGPLRSYALRLLAQFAPEVEDQPARGALVEPISPRELEVLQLMALGKTNEEIARQLVVAPGTIKAHAASIYRKLDVANRTEAVTRARELGILR